MIIPLPLMKSLTSKLEISSLLQRPLTTVGGVVNCLTKTADKKEGMYSRATLCACSSLAPGIFAIHICLSSTNVFFLIMPLIVQVLTLLNRLWFSVFLFAQTGLVITALVLIIVPLLSGFCFFLLRIHFRQVWDKYTAQH